MTLSRRHFLGTLPALGSAGLLFVSPPVHAFPWLVAAQLAISAVGAFTKSDGGMGAYLGALKQLTEENIRLSQEILVQVGRVQQQLALMPTMMSEAFITNNEYIIRERLQVAIDAMALVKAGESLSLADKTRLESIIVTCSELAAKRFLPYGKRGVAATCAPLAAALDIHARKLLGRSNEIPETIRVLYIDWLDQILDFKSEDSLVGLLTQQGKVLGSTVTTQSIIIAKESLTLSKMLETAYLNGIGTKLDKTEVACLELDRSAYTDWLCSGHLDLGDDIGFVQCRRRLVPTSIKRLLASIDNRLLKVEGLPPSIQRPAFSIEVTVEDAATCSGVSFPVLDGPESVILLTNAKKTAIEKTSTQSIEQIDRDRAILSALFQLFQDASSARKLLINRLALGAV